MDTISMKPSEIPGCGLPPKKKTKEVDDDMAPNATTTHTSTCDYVPEFTGVCCPICAYPITAVDLYFGTPAPIVDKLPKFQQQQQQQTRAVSSPVAEIPVALILPPPVNGRSAVCWSDEVKKEIWIDQRVVTESGSN
ncbi:unnamed protein product [Notodromas monacha]|uniref:Uncharacterized protein n=1 Tax=Notodromas monacha TaxID=399045 RepID=A0A7R9GIJ3_9CRUS|nr:unnamed protein product [Notodromas monacha]CAG0922518.1 unnamed protein product [Notodromas monacha]